MTKSDRESKITRRGFTRGALGAAGCVIGLGLLPNGAAADHHAAGESEEAAPPTLVSEVPGNELLLSQVRYVAVSELEGKQCSNCALLVARNGDYGRCGLFQKGQVHATGWCTSWILKPGAAG